MYLVLQMNGSIDLVIYCNKRILYKRFNCRREYIVVVNLPILLFLYLSRPSQTKLSEALYRQATFP